MSLEGEKRLSRLVPGGVSDRVREAVLAGITSVPDIMRVTGVGHAQLAGARITLERRGIDVARVFPDYRIIRRKLRDPHLSAEEGREVMGSVSDVFCKRNSRGARPLFTTVRSFLRKEFGIPSGTDLGGFRAILDQQAGIPLRQITEEIKSGPQKGIRHMHVFPAIYRERAKIAIQVALTSVGGDR